MFFFQFLVFSLRFCVSLERSRLGLEEVRLYLHFGTKEKVWRYFLKIWEKNLRFVEEDWRLTIILIIRVSSFSFLMFYPKFVMYHTSIML